ncbi:MAG TPA: EAL domain-containing protein [Longimicrobium sp.]|jgi:EAL domain-containing protein (putative c-di-GMP-specific phosphodiesterase class I)
MHCECKTDQRRLALVIRGFGEYPELQAFGAEHGWDFHPELGAIAVDVGEGRVMSGIAELASFLRAVLDPARFQGVRAAWVRRELPLSDQLPALIHAEPLAAMVSADSSELMPLLNEERIESWFQPVFRAGTLELWGYECLMRGRALDGSLVSPATLLEWARQEHLTFMLDRVVRELHLRAAGRLQVPAHCQFLVNFLPTAIYRPDFCLATTVRAARESGIEPRRITFEVVETEQMADRDHLRRILAHYREKGFGVALDDVGSGYSGLSLMADLDPDLIKIDRELVSKSAGSAAHRGICASLVGLGREQGRMVLAEGVETEAEWKVMEELGVDLLQGYYFGRPSPIPALTVV